MGRLTLALTISYKKNRDNVRFRSGELWDGWLIMQICDTSHILSTEIRQGTIAKLYINYYQDLLSKSGVAKSNE